MYDSRMFFLVVDFPGGPRDLFLVFGDLRRVMGCMISSPPARGMLTGCDIHLRQKKGIQGGVDKRRMPFRYFSV